MTSTVEQIEALFHPRSVAIVGLPRGLKMGKLFLLALQDQKFPGDIYPVNPNVSEIDGLTTYPSLSAIPGPVDLAIVLVPSGFVPKELLGVDSLITFDCLADRGQTATGETLWTWQSRYNVRQHLTQLDAHLPEAPVRRQSLDWRLS